MSGPIRGAPCCPDIGKIKGMAHQPDDLILARPENEKGDRPSRDSRPEVAHRSSDMEYKRDVMPGPHDGSTGSSLKQIAAA